MSDHPAFEKLRRITTWKKGSQRAVHKPLLLLLTLASVQNGNARLTSYSAIHEKLKRLLMDFGPRRSSYHPEYPFWRLQNDGDFWDIPQAEAALQAYGKPAGQGNITGSVLKKVQASAGFTLPLFEELQSDPDLVNKLTAEILEEHFPPSLHDSILNAVDMPWVAAAPRPTRSRAFRDEVIRVYEHRCAMCGFDGRLGNTDLALEAAHIQWHACQGPDHSSNGLLLCTLHHRALDRGAIGISEDHLLLVSQHLHGGSRVTDWIVNLSGEALRAPIDLEATPEEKYIHWHRKEVFRGPARGA